MINLIAACGCAGKKIPAFIVFIAILAPLFAQNISAYGSVEGNFTLNYFNKNSPLYTSTMGGYSLDNYLLFNTNTKLSAGTAVFAVINADVLFQELLSSQNNQELQTITFTLNEAYLSIPLADFLFFSLGKKRIVWGIGLSYNPSDFINPPKDPLDSRVEKRGVYCAMLELFTEWLSVTLVVVLYDQLDHFGYGTKLSTSSLIPSTDISLIFYYSDHARFNFGAAIDSTPFGELPVLENLALHAEAGFSQNSQRLICDENTQLLALRELRTDFYKNFLIGLRYTIPGWETLITAEYYYVDDGYNRAELDTILNNGFITQIRYEPGLMCRHNLMISIMQPQLTRRSNAFSDTLAVSATMLLNLEDSSCIITGKIESSIVTNCLFTLEAGYFTGGNATEYRLSPKEFYLGFSTIIGF